LPPWSNPAFSHRISENSSDYCARDFTAPGLSAFPESAGCCSEAKDKVLGGWSLALIGNASGQTFGAEEVSIRGVFDKETRRKPLAFAADALSYGV
jgi:hypothetical protein